MSRARFASTALLFAVSGCSAIFDMGAYDDGAKTTSGTTSDGGRIVDRDASVEPNGGNDSASGSSDAQTSADADGSVKAACAKESEPNDGVAAADVLAVGDTCGVLSDGADEDFFKFSTSATTTFEISLTPALHADLDEVTNGTVHSSMGGGFSSKPIPAGDYVLHISYSGNDGPLAYTITRK